MTRVLWPGLDGLRGIAVLAVVLFHASSTWGRNGYVGVDVFFALSGFLITALLIKEHQATGRIAFRRFYARRFLRLYPALVVTCAAVLSAGFYGGTNLTPGVLAALFYYTNWRLYMGNPTPLLEHTWTLAIEEHFYLLWPWIVSTFSSGRTRVKVTGFAISLGLLVVLGAAWPESIAAVKGSYLRGAPIVWGALLAAALQRDVAVRLLRSVVPVLLPVAVVALLAILIVPKTIDPTWLQGIQSIPGLLAIIVISAIVTRPELLFARWLEGSALRWIGRRAYGIYLYHFPILSLAIHQFHMWNVGVRTILAVAATFAAAAASYRWIEAPFLRIKDRFAIVR